MSTTGTEVTDSTSAKAAIDNAKAAGTTGAVATPAESTTGAAPATAPVSAFAAEDAELANLEKAAADEAAGGTATEKGGTTGVTGTETATAATAAAEGGKADTGTAKAGTAADATAAAAAKAANPQTGAIIALRKQNQELATANAILTGENRVLAKFAQPGGTAAEAGGDTGTTTTQPTAEEVRLQELETERERIAGEVDLGRMTMLDFAQATNKIDKEVRAVTLEQAAAIAEANSQPANDLGLTEHLATLPTRYPVLTRLNADQLKPFEALAYEAAAMAGKPITPDAVGTKELRERMGALATSFYGTATERAAAAKGASGATTTTDSSGKPTAAQREVKLALAATHPPDITSTGSGSTGGEPTEAQAEAALAQGDDAAIRWLEQHPGFESKQMRGVLAR